MEMAQIRYVLAAAKHLNFTRAAAECNVTQPALTKGVKALEGELGAPVFHREGRRILVSEFGQSMLPHLRHIAEEAEATQKLAQNYQLLRQTPIRLGVISTIGHMRLSQFLGEFHAENAAIELSVSEAGIAELKDSLAEGRIDVAIMTLTDDLEAEFRAEPLYTERYVVVFPPGHHLSAQSSVTLKDLSGEDYVDRLSCEMREMVMSVCEARKIELYARFRSEREDWVQAMVLAGIGFAFMPECSVTLPGLLQRPLVEPLVERRVAAITVPGRPFSPALEALMRSARHFAWPG